MIPGFYIQELSTFTPLKCYCPIENIVAILNRGIVIDFPQQSKKQELSKKKEDFLLDYFKKQNNLYEKNGNVSSDANSTLETIKEINDS